MKTKKSRILLSAVSVLLVFSLLVGGTMAWFTDTEKVDANFTAGILDINVKPDIENQATLEFKNLRPMQYGNFENELNPAGGANNVDKNGMDIKDFDPAPVYFQPVKITNDGTLPTKVDISVNLDDICDDGEANIDLSNENNTVNWDKDNNVTCTNGLQKVLKIFVYKNTDDGWKRIEGVNLNTLYKENIADPDNAAKDNTALETENMYTTAMIPAGGNATYVIAGYLPETVSNMYQGKHYHADLMFNAYQMDNGAGGGNPDEGGSSSKPEAKDVQIVVHYTLADGTKAGEDYSVRAKSDDFPYTVTEAMAAPGLPQGYHFTDPEQSYMSELTGDDTASAVTFIVEADSPVEEDVQVKINYIDREVDPSKILKTHTETVAIADGGSYTLTNADDVVKNNLPTASAGYVYVFDAVPQTQTVTYPDDFSANLNVAGYRFADMTFYVKLEMQEPENPDDCPYSHIIHNEDELKQVVNHMGHNFVVANDFSLTRGWEVLGLGDNTDTSFTGTFDGNGYTISGLHSVKDTYSNIGLFALNNGTIKNLNLSVNQMEGSQYVGTIAGQNQQSGVISNVHVTGNYVGALSKSNDGGFAGGLVGRNDGVIEDCSSNIKGSGVTRGVVAYNYAGGLVGGNYGAGIIRTSYALGGINSGYVNDINAGNVSTYFAGGLVGGNTGTIENCYVNAGDYIAGVQNTGGFAGFNGSSGKISNCYVVPNDKVYGGVNYGTISIGKNSGAVSYSYAESTTAGTVNGFTRITKANLTSGNALNGFNDSIWNFSNGSYPDLKSNPAA